MARFAGAGWLGAAGDALRCVGMPTAADHTRCIAAAACMQAFWDDVLCGDGEQGAPCEQLELLTAPAGSGSGGSSASSTNTSSNSGSGGSSPGWSRFLNMAAYSRRAVLVALAAAGWAEQLQALTDGEVVASAMQALASMFPGAAPAWPRSYMLSRWGQDPWALGSLSYYDGGCAWLCCGGGAGEDSPAPSCCAVQAVAAILTTPTAHLRNPHLPACLPAPLQWEAPPPTAPRWRSRRAAAWCWRGRRPLSRTPQPCTAPSCPARKRRTGCWTRRGSCPSAAQAAAAGVPVCCRRSRRPPPACSATVNSRGRRPCDQDCLGSTLACETRARDEGNDLMLRPSRCSTWVRGPPPCPPLEVFCKVHHRFNAGSSRCHPVEPTAAVDSPSRLGRLAPPKAAMVPKPDDE